MRILVFCFKYLYLQIKITQVDIGTFVDSRVLPFEALDLSIYYCVFTFANRKKKHTA